MQQESSDKDGQHAGPHEAFDDVRILGGKLPESCKRLAFFEKQLHLPTQTVQLGRSTGAKAMRAKRRKQVDVLLRSLDVKENEPQLPALAFDQEIDIAVGESEVPQLLPAHILAPEWTAETLHDCGIEAPVADTPEVVTTRISNLGCVLISAVATIGKNELAGEIIWLRQELPFCLFVWGQADRDWLPLVETVGAVDLNRGWRDFGEPAGKLARERWVERERTAVLNDNVVEVFNEGRSAGHDRLVQLRHQGGEAVAKELWKARRRESVVKRLVGHRLTTEVGKEPNEIRDALRGAGRHARDESPQGPNRGELAKALRETRHRPQSADLAFGEDSFDSVRASAKILVQSNPSSSLL